MSNALLKLSGVTKIYSGKTALDNVSLDVNEGEVLAIIGPSGSGKTTLLKTMNLIHMPSSGYISYKGETIFNVKQVREDQSVVLRLFHMIIGRNAMVPSHQELILSLNEYRRNFGMVFQEFNLWPNLTLFDNIAAPLRWSLYLQRNEIQVTVERYARLVQIEDIVGKYPNEVSGGQRQRAAIARSLVVKPSILLLDEITSALDPELVSGILELIEQVKERGHTMVIVTHHMSFAKRVADRVAFVTEGEIYEIGRADALFSQPRTQELQEFLGYFESI